MAAGKCKAAYYTDEWHGYGCGVTDGACMFLYPDSKACAEKFGEGPDAEVEEEINGLLLHLPCAVGDTVYVIAECENIPAQLDGSLYGEDGDPGSATGYYCPYENNCPFDDGDFDNCDDYKKKTAVFEDTVVQIVLDEQGIHIFTENCCVLGRVGENIFFEKERALLSLCQQEN